MTPLYRAAEVGESSAVVTVDGDLVAYATGRIARHCVRLLNMLAPTPEQLAGLLGEGTGRGLLLRLDDLRSDAPCHRCGQVIPSHGRAWWSPYTRLVRHFGRCPSGSGKRAAW